MASAGDGWPSPTSRGRTCPRSRRHATQYSSNKPTGFSTLSLAEPRRYAHLPRVRRRCGLIWRHSPALKAVRGKPSEVIHEPNVQKVHAMNNSASAAEPTVRQLFDLSGQVALITGGCGHLGSAMCRGLAEAGASVVVT